MHDITMIGGKLAHSPNKLFMCHPDFRFQPITGFLLGKELLQSCVTQLGDLHLGNFFETSRQGQVVKSFKIKHKFMPIINMGHAVNHPPSLGFAASSYRDRQNQPFCYDRGMMISKPVTSIKTMLTMLTMRLIASLMALATRWG